MIITYNIYKSKINERVNKNKMINNDNQSACNNVTIDNDKEKPCELKKLLVKKEQMEKQIKISTLMKNNKK